MHPHWQDGTEIGRRVAQQLLDNFDCQGATLDELESCLVAMVFQRANLANNVLNWLQHRLDQSDADPRAILTDLVA